MRYLVMALSVFLLSLPAAKADVRLGAVIDTPEVSIGISVSDYPRLVRIPGYPVYYDPHVELNYFFYDGLYWVFHDDGWYASEWYDGPWRVVDRYRVPVYVLRIPVRYYRRPPGYFHGWHRDAPPRWGEHWGHEWAEKRHGWDRWDRHAAPPPAPLPKYQRNYRGDHYPMTREQQSTIREERYRYHPKDPVVRDDYRQDRDRDGPRSGGRPDWKGPDNNRGHGNGPGDNRGNGPGNGNGGGHGPDRH